MVFQIFIIIIVLVVAGGLTADYFLNTDSRKLLEDKRSGLSRITAKYNEQIRTLESQYKTEKSSLVTMKSSATRTLRKNYSSRYEQLRTEYLKERLGFIEFWQNENKRYRLFRKIWGWILVLGVCGAVFSCSYAMDGFMEGPPAVSPSGETTYWNAENIPLPHLTDGSQYVSNPDNVLSATTVSQVNQTMRQLDDEFGIESAVVVVNHIENDDPFRFAQDIGNRYGVGRQDRGLVIVVGYEDHSVNIAPGRSLEADLTDAECYRLEQRYVVPAMKAEQPDSAMLYLAEGLYAFLKDKPMPEMSVPRSETDGDMAILGLFFWFFVGWFIFTMIMDRKYEWLAVYGTAALLTNPFVEQTVYVSSGGFSSGGSRGGFGGGFGGGGSFGGGYGGGSFGGGGATSRW